MLIIINGSFALEAQDGRIAHIYNISCNESGSRFFLSGVLYLRKAGSQSHFSVFLKLCYQMTKLTLAVKLRDSF